MTSDFQNILAIREMSLRELKLHDGVEWKESQGELHAQNKEIANWILLFEDSDIKKCHETFFNIIQPFMNKIGDFNFTVSYKILTKDEEIFIEFLSDNEEITSASNDLDSLGFSPTAKRRGESNIFDSADSFR